MKTSTIVKRVLYTIALPVLLYAVLCIAKPANYFKLSVAITLIKQAMVYSLLGWSMVFGMSCGLFDFSVGARYMIASMFGIWLSQKMGVVGFVLGVLVGSVVLGALTGAIYAGLKIPSIITGFAVLLILESLSCIIQNLFPVIITSEISIFGREPGIYIVTALCFVLVYALLNYTKFGYQIKAIGGNEKVARSMGINAVRLKVMTYIIGGLILGIASLVKLGYDQQMRAQTAMASMSVCFTPMMAVMIGLYLSSCNPVVGTYIGALSISIVSAALVAFGIDYRLQNVFIGAFLLVFIAYKVNVTALLGKLKRKQSAEVK